MPADRSTKERLALALEAGAMGTWEWEPLTGAVTWSPTLEQMHGIPVGSFGGTFEDYQRDIHPEDRERVLATIARSAAGEGEHHLEYRIVTPAGQVRWLEARGRLLRDADGAPERMLGICSDVTARKAAEEAVRESREWFATTLLSIGDAVIATDDTGRVTLMNGVAQELTGWSQDAARDRPLEEVFHIVHETTRAGVESPVAKVLREGRVVGLANHTILIRRDGTEIAIDDSAAPIRSSGGDLVGVVLVFRDVTEQRRVEQRREFISRATAMLASSLDYEETLRRAVALAVPHIADWCAVDLLDGGALRRVAVAHVDPEKVALAHEMARRYPPDPSAPHGAHAVIRTGASQLVEEIPDALLVQATRDDEHLAMARALGLGSYMSVPIRAGGGCFGAFSFVQAESNRRFGASDLQLAEEIGYCAGIAIDNARLFREKEQALRTREDLIAIVSHDLRNSLGVISLKAELIKLRAAGQSVLAEDANAIGRNVRQMTNLIHDLLDYATIESGAFTVSPAPHDAGAIVAEAVELIAPLAADKSQELSVSGSAELRVRCDRQRVLQVLSNLLGNAVKFTPRGGRVSVAVAADGGDARFSVADTGPGVPPAEVANLFTRYWRGQPVQEPGRGLGLYIAKGIVDAHGGRIWADSAGGAGTTFTFTLPLA